MIYVLDTNIVLQDPTLSNYKGKTVYLPIEVLKELDNQKTREGEVGFKSRVFHRKLKEVENLKEDFYYINETKVINPTKELEQLDGNNNFKPEIADHWFIQSFILNRKEEFIAHTSDFSCYNLMRVHGKNCEYVNHKRDDFSKMVNTYKEVYVSSNVINNLDLFRNFNNYGCMDYLLLINEENPKHSRLVKIRNNKLKDVSTKIKPYGATPLNLEQKIVMDSLLDDDVKVVILSARQGTGKTYLSLACALEQTVNHNNYSRILLGKSQAPLSKFEEIGWLSGDIDSKLRYSMVSYYSNLEALSNGAFNFEKDGRTVRFDGSKLFDEFKSRGQMDFLPLDSILGASFDRTYVLIDEAQSLDYKMIRSCLTRIKDNSKLVLLGDVQQNTDAMKSMDSSGLYIANKYLRNVEGVCVLSLSEIERGKVCNNIAEALDNIEVL